MFKHNSLSLCCAAPSVQVTRAEKAAGQIRGGTLSVGLRSCLCCIVRRARDHLQKSSARLNLKLNMDKRARSRSQMMISSKCTKQTKDTHTRLLSSGSSEWTGLDRGTACIEAANRIKQQRSEVVENKKALSHSVNPHVISWYMCQCLMWQNKKNTFLSFTRLFSPPVSNELSSRLFKCKSARLNSGRGRRRPRKVKRSGARAGFLRRDGSQVTQTDGEEDALPLELWALSSPPHKSGCCSRVQLWAHSQLNWGFQGFAHTGPSGKHRALSGSHYRGWRQLPSRRS